MKTLIALAAALLCGLPALGQDTFTVTGTIIPSALLTQNYGSMPKGIVGYDLTICNATEQKQPVVSSQVYQALAASTGEILPVGRQILLASILSSQRRDVLSLVTFGLNTAVGIFSLMSSSNSMNPPPGVKTGVSLVAISVQQFTSNFKSILPADKLQKFDNDALPQAMVLDSNTCVEKTLFALVLTSSVKPAGVEFHIK
jgi:multisubunit Na+/H+ antiporter MnhC subunit